MENLDQRIASLSPEKRALLAQLKKKNSAGSPPASTTYHIPKIGHNGIAPLSYAQQRLWFLDQLEPGSPLYNLHLSLRLQGKVDFDALHQAINTIISRHEALRTTFQMQGNQACQVILPEYKLDLPTSDLSHILPAEREGKVCSIVIEEAQRPFDFSMQPPLRARLLKFDEEDHVFIMIIHHIIIDGWSLGVFNKELGLLYSAICSGKEAALPDLPVQYIDFSDWQRQRLQDEVLEKQIKYWVDQLDGAPPLLELPTDRPRPAENSICGARQAIILPKELTAGLKTLCQQEQVTLFMILLAAYQTFLFRYSGQDDIVIGSPVASRIQPEIEGLIGFFINALVFRTDLSGNPTFRDLLARVKKTALDAYSHQDIPFEKLVEKLKPQRNLSYSPIYQVAFAFQNMHTKPLSLQGLTVTPLEIDRGTATFDLSLFVINTDQGLKILFEYNTDLFDDTTIGRMLGHYQQLLEGIVEDPDQTISTLPLLADAEKNLMLKTWNDTQADYPKDKSLVQLFEQQVLNTPDQFAVATETNTLTYAQLNARANQVAHYLRNKEVKTGSIVGLCLGRSTEMFIGMLGILKSGAAYLPLDPDYPPERLQFMISDCKVSTVITLSQYQEMVACFHTKTVCLDTDWQAISSEADENPLLDIHPENLCYIIYTSGSTGMPKGVLIEHRNIVHSVTARINYYPETVKKFILLSSFAFDSSVAGIFWTLYQGGTLYLPRQGDEKDLYRIAAIIEEERPTHMLSLPSVYNLLLNTPLATDTANEQPLTSLNTVIVAGEACPPALIEQHHEKLPQAVLYNEYGPTEGTVWSTVYRTGPQDLPLNQVPIGKPIQNVQTYILDPEQQPVPIGVKGELYIGGAGVAHGYLNNDVYNRTKFIVNPFLTNTKERIYRTGDLARFLPDGNIMFMGRIDSQVKIRGYRIELGEIESIITSHPAISEAVVIDREDTPGDKRLVAYIINQQGHDLTTPSIKEFLLEKLPAYMAPTSYVFLDRFLLTPNGKVDRKALPAPDHAALKSGEECVPPRSETEKILVKIWADTLNIEKVGIHDNFFDLGGHSLLGVYLLNNIEKATGKRLPIAALFKTPTIEGMSSFLEDKPASDSKSQETGTLSRWNSLVAVKPNGSRTPFFCVHGRAHSLAEHMHPDQPLYWLHHGQDARRTIYHTVEEIAADHLKEIRNVQAHGPYCLGGFSFGGMVAFEIAQQLLQQGEDIALLALFDPTLVDKFSSVEKQKTKKNVRKLSHKFKLKNNVFYKLGRASQVIKANLRRIYKRCQEKLKMMICKICMAFGKPVPSSIAVFNLIELFQEAAAHYKYQSFPGLVTMFIPDIFKKRRNLVLSIKQRWTNIAQEGIEIRFVKGATSHHKMVEEPHVQDLISQLELCLKNENKIAAESTAHSRSSINNRLNNNA